MNGTLEDLTINAEREFEKSCKRTHFYRVQTIPGLPTLVHPMLCKKRTCEECGFYWRWKCCLAIAEKKASLDRQGLAPITRALTLTTAYNCGYKKMWSALRYFWQQLRDYSPDLKYQLGPARGSKSLPRIRRYDPKNPFTYDPKIYFGPGYGPRYPYRNIQYWGVLEFNQAHTHPHLHLILCKDSFVPMTLIKACWIKAQNMAKFSTIAWDTRIEKIKFDVSKYFTKYLTKLGNGKDEIPRRENWAGRFTRYSERFFDVPVPAMLTAHSFGKWLENPGFERAFCLVSENMSLEEFVRHCRDAEKELNELVNRAWDYTDDRHRAKILKSNDELIEREHPPPPIERPPHSKAAFLAARRQSSETSTGPIWPCWSATEKRPEGFSLAQVAKMKLAQRISKFSSEHISAPNVMTATPRKARVKVRA